MPNKRTKYADLTTADKKRLRTLAEGLGVPIFPEKSKSKIKSFLAKNIRFQNYPIVKYKDGLLFHTDVEVSEICHDIAHAIFLGKKIWDKIPEGYTDFADHRWQGKEEMPVMGLQVMIADSCIAYGGSRQCFIDMLEIGYGFGTTSTERQWYSSERFRDLRKAKSIKTYPDFKSEDNYYD